jgi:uncharacterized membrane protein
MEVWLFVNVLSRFLHVGTAIVLVGGSVFMRFVLMPAAEKLAPDAHEALRASILRVWKMFVIVGIAVLLITGFYNYLVVTLPSHKGDSLYHMLIGIKILLALVVFFLASVLVGRAAAFEPLRQNRKTWLVVVIILAALIVAISGFVKVRKPPHAEGEARSAATGQTGMPTVHF